MLTCLKTTNKPQKTLTIKTINNASSGKSHWLVKMTSKPKKTSISKNDQECIKLCQLIKTTNNNQLAKNAKQEKTWLKSKG
jgi:hypothetical protein